MSLPAIQALIRKRQIDEPDEKNYLLMNCKLVEELMPWEAFKLEEKNLQNFPGGFYIGPVVALDIRRVFDNFTPYEHPTRTYFATVGLQQPENPVSPEILVDERDWNEEHPEWSPEIVIAPTTMDPVRAWPMDKWDFLINILEKKYRIGIVGAGKEDLPRFCHRTSPGEYKPGDKILLDAPLTRVAGVMKRAKCMIGVDTGAGRLMQVVCQNYGIPHVNICSAAVAERWGTYPEAKNIYNWPQAIGVQEVLAKVKEALGA